MNASLMELELGLALPNQTPMKNKGCNKYLHRSTRIIDDDDDGEEEVESKGLSFLLWSGQPNEEDDRNWRKYREIDNVEESEEIVGWPPISSLRKEWLHRHHGDWMAAAPVRAADSGVVPVGNSMFVKVKMEGVPIGRKIDLSRYDSYQALTQALMNMFDKYTSRGEDYAILYQDKEGDWLLAGDLPWEIFVESVQRVKIVRTAN